MLGVIMKTQIRHYCARRRIYAMAASANHQQVRIDSGMPTGGCHRNRCWGINPVHFVFGPLWKQNPLLAFATGTSSSH